MTLDRSTRSLCAHLGVLLIAGACAAEVVACGSDDSAASTPDSGDESAPPFDAGGDRTTPRDAAPDAKDARADATSDATSDAGADAVADTGNPLPICPCWLTDGDYCGQVVLDHAASSNCQVPAAVGNATNLMDCTGGAWTVEQVCTAGCTFRPGLDDICTSPSGYYLPWATGVTHVCTQGHNQGSHTGTGAWAWDFGLAANTPVWAARAGTVTLVQFLGSGDPCFNGVNLACTNCISQTDGVTDCLNRGNYVVVNHGDGTQALYLHLWGVSVSVGQAVSLGQVIGQAGNSGCSCGSHLHYMVSNASSTNYYSQSIPSSFIEAGDPVSGQSVTSQNP